MNAVEERTSGTWSSPPQDAIFVAGWRPGGAGTLKVTEAATGETMGSVGCASREDVRDAVAAAQAAQPAWASAGFRGRAGVLLAAAEVLARHEDELVEPHARESGSILEKARREIRVAQSECRYAAAQCGEPYGALIAAEDPTVLNLTRQVPVGVVGVITPWNAPFALAWRSVAPALALGNAVVLKPDPNTPACGGLALARVLEAAGLPPGLFAVVPGGAEVGDALCRDPGVRVLAFTGATSTGRVVGAACVAHDTIPLLELGGNNVSIVLEDADLTQAVACGARAAFGHAGQICMATGRHLVHESLFEAYVEALVQRARTLTVGDPCDPASQMGPIINAAQLARVEGLVRASRDAGAEVLTGGEAAAPFYPPTVMTGVTGTTPVWCEEVFGPVAPVMSFRDVDEALAIARDTPYGLVAAVHGRDSARALELGSRLGVGIVHVNGPTVGDEAQVPFGGMAASGNGARFGGSANWRAYTETQWLAVHGEHPALGVTAAPQASP